MYPEPWQTPCLGHSKKRARCQQFSFGHSLASHAGDESGLLTKLRPLDRQDVAATASRKPTDPPAPGIH
jgi:hypothetical protein